MAKKKTAGVVIFFLIGSAAVAPLASAQTTLSWQDCVREAAQNHPDLISARQSVSQSSADKRITASAGLPQISSDLSAASAKAAAGGTTETYSYGVTGSQLLFDGAKTGYDVKKAVQNEQAARYEYQFTSADVRWSLRVAFIDLLKVQELLRISEEIVRIRRSNLMSISLRYESGLEHRGALRTAEANLAQAEFEMAQAGRDREVAQQQLSRELGRDAFAPISVQADFTVQDFPQTKPDFEVLVEKNPSMLKAVAQRNSAEFGLKSSQADFYPVVTGRVGANRTDAHWPPAEDRWNTTLAVSFPLFEGGSRLAQRDKARALLDQRRADERSARDGLAVGLETSWATLQDSVAYVDVQKKFLAAAEERSRIAEAQYSLGLIQFDNWTIIQDDLVRAKKSVLSAQASALLAEADWIKAKGETLEYAQQNH